MTDTKHTPDYDVLTHCREQCANGACMSGDTCVQVMHDEPCYTAIADELTRLRAQNAALVESSKTLLEHYTQLVNCVACGNWDPEKEPEVIAMRAALAQAESDQ